MTSRQNTTTGETTAYEYNLDNRLSRAVIHRFDKDGAGTEHAVDIRAAYYYDATGFRVARDVST